MKLLFTSVGRRVELMRSFRAAAERSDFEVTICATDIDRLAPALEEVDKFHLVSRFSDAAYIPELLAICVEEKIDVIFPLIDPDIPLLARHRDKFEAVGTNLAVVDVQAAEISADKWRAYHFFKKLGLPTPQSWLPGDVDPKVHEYPRFIKPRCGSAANDTFRINNADELSFFQTYVPDPIIQEFIPGAEITSDILCDFQGRVLSVVSRQRIAVRGGEVVKGFTVHDPMVAEACHLIAEALPAVGPITAQCMLKDGVAHFIEINARLGGGIPLAIAAGVDIPKILLDVVAGKNVQQMANGSYELGLHMTRFDDSFFLSEKQLT